MGTCGRRKEGDLERSSVSITLGASSMTPLSFDPLHRFQPKGEGAFPGDSFKGYAS